MSQGQETGLQRDHVPVVPADRIASPAAMTTAASALSSQQLCSRLESVTSGLCRAQLWVPVTRQGSSLNKVKPAQL